LTSIQDANASVNDAATRTASELTASLQAAEQALVDFQAQLLQRQKQIQQLEIQRDRDAHQHKLELEQIGLARAAAES
jgi:hypothetical protein